MVKSFNVSSFTESTLKVILDVGFCNNRSGNSLGCRFRTDSSYVGIFFLKLYKQQQSVYIKHNLTHIYQTQVNPANQPDTVRNNRIPHMHIYHQTQN